MGKKKKGRPTWSRRKRKGQRRRPQAGERVQLKEGVAFDCPDCGLRVTIGCDQYDTPVAIHKKPMCATFDALDPDEYLKWARLRMQGKTDA